MEIRMREARKAMEGLAAILEVRPLAAFEVALAAKLEPWRDSEAYFRRWRDGRLKVSLPRVRWLEGESD